MAQRQVPIQQRFASRVREQREALGLSQRDLARLAKTSRSQVFEIEAARKIPTLQTLESFARALRVTPASLIDADVVQKNPDRDEAAGVAELLRARGPHYLRAVKALVRSMDRAVAAALKAASQKSKTIDG